MVVLAALCLRPDLAGVTSLVRGLGLSEASYYCLLHFFHSTALDLELLTRLWHQTLQRLFRRRLVRVNGRAVVLVDGLKRPKEGKKMPGLCPWRPAFTRAWSGAIATGAPCWIN